MTPPKPDSKSGEKSPVAGGPPKPKFMISQNGSITSRTLVIAGLAVVFGVSAVIALREFMKHESGSSNKVAVIMTAQDIPRGITITPEYITTKEYAKEDIPEGALTNPTQAIDRVAEIPMIKGEPVLEGKLAVKGSGRGLAAIVKPGMRAMTIQTTNVATGVAGLIMPGDKVDVLMTMNDPGGGNDTTGGGSTKTLLTKIEVLAVDQRVNEPTNGKVDPKEMRSVTLLVTPEQANKLDLGQNRGILHLTLRNPGDPDVSQAKTETLNDFRFGPNGRTNPNNEVKVQPHPPATGDPIEHDKLMIDTYIKYNFPLPEDQSEHEKRIIASYIKSHNRTPLPTIQTIRTIRGANEGSISYIERDANP